MSRSVLREMIQSLVGPVTCAAIVGYEGGIWMQTPGFFPNQSELNELIKTFDLPEKQLQKGIVFQNDHYLVTQNKNGTIIAKNSFGSIVLCNCESCLVFSFMEDCIDYDKGLAATEDLARRIRETPESELH